MSTTMMTVDGHGMVRGNTNDTRTDLKGVVWRMARRWLIVLFHWLIPAALSIFHALLILFLGATISPREMSIWPYSFYIPLVWTVSGSLGPSDLGFVISLCETFYSLLLYLL
jgi:hypothetical protein